jgi:hypothetical protein
MIHTQQKEHSKEAKKLYADAGVNFYPSAGAGQNATNGYPPNSHETMPNEPINSDFKARVLLEMNTLRKSRRSMVHLHGIIHKVAKEFPRELVLKQIGHLPSIIKEIVAIKGKRTQF